MNRLLALPFWLGDDRVAHMYNLIRHIVEPKGLRLSDKKRYAAAVLSAAILIPLSVVSVPAAVADTGSPAQLRVTVTDPMQRLTDGSVLSVSVDQGEGTDLTLTDRSVDMTGIQAGTHDITIRIDGYETHVQQIRFDAGSMTTLALDTSDGTLIAGDLDGDGTVNVADANLAARALRTGETEPGSHDINGDGTVDLTDVQQFTINATRTRKDGETTITPLPPAAPVNVTAAGAFRSITVTWDAVADATFYIVRYQQAGGETKEKTVTDTTLTLTGLKDDTEYTISVLAVNDHGTSMASDTVTATTNAQRFSIPAFGLINRKALDPDLESHITKVTTDPVDTSKQDGFTSDMVVDGDYDTAWYSSWGPQVAGATVTFDKQYQIEKIILSTSMRSGYGDMSKAKVQLTDSNGKTVTYGNGDQGTGLKTSSLSGATNTIALTFPATNAVKVKVSFARYYTNQVSISELAFYEHDQAADDVKALWADPITETLADGVTAETLDQVQAAVDATDPDTGETNPAKDALDAEIQEARNRLNGLQPSRDASDVDTNNTTKAPYSATRGNNALRTTGVTAMAGEHLRVYVDAPGVEDGASVPIVIRPTQEYGKNGQWWSDISLRAGVNDITIPEYSGGTGSKQKGGQILFAYTGTHADPTQYRIRIFGGINNASLDLYSVTDENDKLTAAKQYVARLRDIVAEYPDRLDVRGGTVIGGRYVAMYLPGVKALDYLGASKSDDEIARQLVTALDALDDMAHLFYQHKGFKAGDLTDEEKARYGANNVEPSGRELYYWADPGGAWAFAGEQAVYVGQDGFQTLLNATPIVSDENGNYVSGSTVGWGLAHEYGHHLDETAYRINEITNNYFATLSTTKGTDSSGRIPYDTVFEWVTAGHTTLPTDVFTQLAIYWQIHLAYDTGGNYKTYDDYSTQMDNLIAARMDSIARNPSTAPSPNGVAIGSLENTGVQSTLENHAKLASAAAGKDLEDYYVAWGVTLSDSTLAYIRQWPKETRPIQYLDDDAYTWKVNGGTTTVGTVSVSAGSTSDRLHVNYDGDTNGLQGFELYQDGKLVLFRRPGKLAADGSGWSFTGLASGHEYSVRAVTKDMQVNAMSEEVTR